ncbi:hypothetical protein M885DRAFT_513115 [Pelagophyceae sp. CCMP2097]|nr:hypothetical protein M885DRAFT_513115 [Pelagophyceae sp. CCMP2097]
MRWSAWFLLPWLARGLLKNAEFDEALLPELANVLEEVGLVGYMDQLANMGIERTLSLLRWDRTDVNIQQNELGWAAAESAALLSKLDALRNMAKVAGGAAPEDRLGKLRKQRAASHYGRVYVDRATGTFEFKKAWFGLQDLPEGSMPLVRAVPTDGCGTLATSHGNRTEVVPSALYAGAAVLVDRGRCTFVEKAWAAHFAGARALLIINSAKAPFERPASGHVTDETETLTPPDLAVVLLQAESEPALAAIAAAPLLDPSVENYEAHVSSAQKRSFLARRKRDFSRPPFDVADATRVRLVPVQCKAGEPECKPLLPAERARRPEVSSGHVHLVDAGGAAGAGIEFVTSTWAGVLPARDLAIVRAEPVDLCQPNANRLCRALGGLACSWTGSSAAAAAFAERAVAALVVADRGGCAFGVKAFNAALLGAAAVVFVERGESPLLRMGVRLNGTLPPAIAAALVDAEGGDALVAAAAHSKARFVAADAPFADQWLELAEAEPWPENDVAAKLLRRRLQDTNAQSPARLRWLAQSWARRSTCAAEGGC